jgi:hypothetical protein
VSGNLLSKLDHGDIVVRPNIERFDGDRVRFTDGSAEQIDAVIYCTGYKISFPFLDEALIGADGDQIPLYHRIVPPKLAGLYFIGLVQPIGAIMPIAEIQSEWVADLLQGRAILPPEPQMNREIARYRAMTVKRYARSTRDTIQVDFLAYLREIRRERRAGARRGAVSRVTAAAPSATRTPPPSCTGRVAPELAHHLGRDGIVRGHLGEQDGDGAGRCRDVGCGSGAADPAVASRDVPWIDGLHIRPGTVRRMGSARGRPALRVRISS